MGDGVIKGDKVTDKDVYIHKNVANLDFDSVVNNDLHSGYLKTILTICL